MAYSASFGSGGGATVAQSVLNQRAAPAQAASPPGVMDPNQKAPIPTAPRPAAPSGLAALPPFLRDLNPPGAINYPAGSTDPAYLAYQRQLEYQRQVAGLAAQRSLQNLAGQMVIGPQQLAAQGEIARRGISGGLEARGLFRSGERLRDLADQRANEAQRLAAIRLSGAGQFGDILTTLQGNLAGLSNQSADQALANDARNVVA